MHGLALVQKLIQLAEQLVEEKKARSVTRINLQVSEWSHFTEKELNFVLKELGKGTRAAKAKIKVQKVSGLPSEYVVESIDLEFDE